MVEALEAWLAAQPDPAVERLCRHVLGGPAPARPLAERALLQRLGDRAWIAKTLAHLGPRAARVLSTLLRTGVPVLRGDLNALANVPDFDAVEALEDHGLVTAVRTGRGMPTHVALTPGLNARVAAELGDAQHPGRAGGGAAHAGDRRRFELALVMTCLAHHPPRMTREGRLHAGDLTHLAERLEPLHLAAPVLERLLSNLTELGAFAPADGRLRVVPAAATELELLHLRLALTELAAPSTPEGALALVAQLVDGATLPVHEVLEAAQVAILRERAAEEEAGTRRGARRELAETLTVLFGLAAVVLLDEHGAPAGNSAQAVLARLAAGDALQLALEPDVRAVLRGEPRPSRRYAPGHVQSSFEVVADAGCDPSLVARVGLSAELVRADQAAVLRLTREAVVAGRAAGVKVAALGADLEGLSGRPLPANVAHVLADWYARATDKIAPPAPVADPPALEALRAEALAALAQAAIVAGTPAAF